MEILKKISEQFEIDNDVKASSISRYPEVITMEEQSDDEEEIWIILKEALTQAC